MKGAKRVERNWEGGGGTSGITFLLIQCSVLTSQSNMVALDSAPAKELL